MRSLVLKKVTFFVLGLALLGGCGGDDGDDAAKVEGTFRGTIQDSVAGPGTVTVTLAQDGNDLTGTYQTTFANARNNGSGSVKGEVNGTAVTLTTTSSVPTSCPFNVTATVNGGQITGTYAAFNCTVAASGTLTVTRQ